MYQVTVQAILVDTLDWKINFKLFTRARTVVHSLLSFDVSVTIYCLLSMHNRQYMATLKSSGYKLTPPVHGLAHHYTISFKKFYANCSGMFLTGLVHKDVKFSNGSFWHWWVSGLAIVTACFIVQMYIV